MFQAARTTTTTRPRLLLQSISSQLAQRCFAGGTPKGKAKIKEGGPKQRSKITHKKKPTAAPGDPSLRPESRADTEKYKLYEACINAPTPVRFLKPKERAREAEREKLGIESKERKREKDMMKKGGVGADDSPFGGTPGLDLITLGLVDADKIPKYELTVEDGRWLAKEYSRVLMRKHRARQAALSSMLKCKKAAIEALPEDLKKEALVDDFTPFPAERGYAMLTPPIEGYMEKVMEAAKRSSGSEKIR